MDWRGLVFVALYFTGALCSGVAAHLLILLRVHHLLPEQLQKYELFLHAGAFFPDLFYNCLGLDLAAEEAHWPPFLLQTALYLQHKRTKYLAPQNLYDAETEAFEAFMYGVLTHQIADSTWHSIRMNGGLLQHLAKLEFDGDIDAAHAVLDTGGDLVLLQRLSPALRTISPDSELVDYFALPWKAPINELVDIYNLLGYGDVSASNLQYCLRRGYAALSIELNGFRLALMAYLRQYPYLSDVLDSYYLGGLEEIEVAIQRCIGSLGLWFNESESSLRQKNPWDLCRASIVEPKGRQGLSVTLSEPKVSSISQNGGYYLTPNIQNGRFGKGLAIGHFLGSEYGPCVAVGLALEELDGSVYVVPLNSLGSKSTAAIKVLRNGGRPHRYGSKLAKFTVVTDQDEVDYLVIAAPGNSRIDILRLSEVVAEIHFEGDQFEQMGLVLEVSDVTGDGISDIIVGSPFSYKQTGCFVVLDGRKIIEKVISGHTRFSYLEFAPIEISLPNEISLEDGYENFCSSLSVGSKHLYVGVRAFGSVFSYEVPLNRNAKPTYVFEPGKMPEQYDSKPMKRMRSRDTGLYASSFIWAGLYANQEWLLVGAHSESYEDCVNCGAVHVYRNGLEDPVLDKKVVLKTKDGLQKYNYGYSKFGYSGWVNGSTVYISSPTMNAGGGIFAFDLLDGDDGPIIGLEMPILLGGSAFYSSFGESLTGFQDILVVGMPNYGYGYLKEDEKKLTGRVGLYDIRK